MSASRAQRVRNDASIIARYAGPLLINNLATAGMLSADTIMAGRLGADQLAAVAVGANFISLFYFTAIGMLMGLSPIVAHAYGSRRFEDIGPFVRQGLWLSVFISVFVLVGVAFVEPALLFIGIEAPTADLARRYAWALAPGLPALNAFYALRFSSEGIGWTRPVMYTAAVGLVTNIFLNYVFMYGKLGAPALGAVGTGVATAITYWLLFVILFVYVKRHPVYRPYRPLGRFDWPHGARLRELAHLSLPIAGSLIMEGGLFSIAALIIGSLGSIAMAAHAIAINYAALMFMIPLSMHSATTIHVGHQLGRGDRLAGRRAGWVGIGLATGVMAVSACVLILARDHIAALYTRDATVFALATKLLWFAAVFQLADGMQVGAAGALRGFKDTRLPLLFNIVAYWGVGFPLAWYLGIELGGGPQGVWTGLIVSLFTGALLQTLRYRHITRQFPQTTSRVAQ
ncbi:MAG: MATE family efflux transporter [Steroidobacteraceae bacterium]